MGAHPVPQASHIGRRLVSVVAGVVLAILIVQHSATRRSGTRDAA